MELVDPPSRCWQSKRLYEKRQDTHIQRAMSSFHWNTQTQLKYSSLYLFCADRQEKRKNYPFTFLFFYSFTRLFPVLCTLYVSNGSFLFSSCVNRFSPLFTWNPFWWCKIKNHRLQDEGLSFFNWEKRKKKKKLNMLLLDGIEHLRLFWMPANIRRLLIYGRLGVLLLNY